MNWDKLEAEVKKEEKDEKLDGEQALQKLFRDIYGGADEDTRRAMNKSFQVPMSSSSRYGSITCMRSLHDPLFVGLLPVRCAHASMHVPSLLHAWGCWRMPSTQPLPTIVPREGRWDFGDGLIKKSSNW